MKNKKTIAILVVLIILAGIIMVFTKGFNKDISYQKATRIEVNIPKGYEKDDIKQIAEEVFSDKNIQMQDIEKTNQVVSVRIKDYTEEELNNFKTIISEKYGIEQDKLTVEEVKIPGTKMLTLVTPYLFSLGLVTVLTIIYICLKNIKKEISDYVVNEDVLKDYLDSINKDMIIKDIDILINKGEVDHTDKFYKIIEKYDSNKEICDLYSKNVNSIYKNNLFPSKEFGIINVFKLRQDFIPFFIIFIALLMTMSVILKCISNKRKYFDIAIMGTGILTSMLILIRHYLKGLYYTNDYFTLFILLYDNIFY